MPGYDETRLEGSARCPYNGSMVTAMWTDISSLLRERLESGHYKVWIEPLAGAYDGAELTLHAVSAFAAGFVRDNFLAVIREAARDHSGRDIPVRIVDTPPAKATKASSGDVAAGQNVAVSVPSIRLSPNMEKDGGTPPPLVAGTMATHSWTPTMPLLVEGQHSLPIRYSEEAFKPASRSWRHSFDDFVVGPCNELAFAASRNMCRENRSADILFLSSAPGLGKTHLIQAVGQQLYKNCNYRAPRVEYLTAEEFASRLVMAFKGSDTDRFKARYRDADVLLLEDVHFLQGKEKIQEELLSTLKALHERGGKMIFSSSFIPRQLQGMSSELLSRLHSGLLAAIDRPDREMRKRIFREKARLTQVTLPEDVSDFLADSIDSDVRQIESCLQNLVLKASLLRCGITMQMAWEAVQYYAPREKELDLEKILAYVAKGYGITVDQMRSKNRKRNLVLARNTVYFLARKHTELSLEEIGSLFGRRHSTVIKGITSLEREMSRETSLGRQIANAISIIERTGSIISPS